ncbi:hypothetical protein ACFY7H_23900 [Streptomyces sp. NPDC012794]|uniref:hypothetical protein n=1 Tax=Streptomyces sp. NPDC012794 TaxID=3364850 RepID=UPI0036B0CC99
MNSTVPATARRDVQQPLPLQFVDGPPSPDALCRYGAEWTATKLRWRLQRLVSLVDHDHQPRVRFL